VARLDFISRHASSAVSDALADTRAVLVNGARQAGKSTLVRALAGQQDAEWRDLDLPQDRQSALEDSVGFVSFGGLTVIDEIQRAPELLTGKWGPRRARGSEPWPVLCGQVRACVVRLRLPGSR
jgi:predicted AAA+ superfamily ATPase